MEIFTPTPTSTTSDTYYIIQNNFWPGFGNDDDPCYKFFIDLLSRVFKKPIIKTQNPYEADILLESIGFTNTSSIIHLKQWKYKILFSGEPRLCPQYEFYDCILWGRTTGEKIVCFPLFILDTVTSKSIEQISDDKKRKSIRDEILPKHKKLLAIISNGGSQQRNNILDELEKHFEIDYGGGFRTNRSKIDGGFHGETFWKEISNYRGILCLENSRDTDYITEKIIHGFAGNTIPIYWGASNITSYFNKNSFILINDENNLEEPIQEIKRIMEDDKYYIEKINQPIFNNNMNGQQFVDSEINRIVDDIRACLSII